MLCPCLAAGVLSLAYRGRRAAGVSAPEILENILSNTVKTEDPSALPRTHYEPSVEKNLSSVFIDEFILKVSLPLRHPPHV